MNQKTTDTTLFLNKCFYLCFHTQEEYKVDIKKFITSSGDKLTFDFFGFIDNLKSQKETYGLIPIDVFYNDYCTKDILQKIEESFEAAVETGGYTRLFLEYLFDERFKEEFNIMVKKLKSTFTNSYFSTKNKSGLFYFDMVGRYFDNIKDSYRGFDTGYDFSLLTDREAVYSTKNENVRQGKHGIEKLDNVFSMYKFYGQEKYSRTLISLLKHCENDKNNIAPQKMMDLSSETIMSDDNISQTIPDNKTPEVLRERILFLELKKLQEELQRFFDDFVPSHLDREFVLNGTENHKNEKLREQLIRDFKGILSEEWQLYKKINCNDDLYEELSVRRSFFSYYELQKIENEFNQISKDEKDYSLAEKIEYIKSNNPKLNKESSWNTIFEKFKEYYPISLEENFDKIDKENTENRRDVDNSEKNILITLFEKSFAGEQQFLSALIYDLSQFENLDVKDFMTKLKGSADHPWARFWTVYNRNAEIHLYPEQKLFTKVMNHIETESKKTISG
ncbi:MAG: hypothetical protein SPJ55_12825 [Treponema sp.]|nr:hypothetical protein [Treponema sp.]